jgi:hypothetical protein
VPEQWRGNGAKRNDLAIAEAEGPQGPEAHTVLLCEVPIVFIPNDHFLYLHFGNIHFLDHRHNLLKLKAKEKRHKEMFLNFDVLKMEVNTL